MTEPRLEPTELSNTEEFVRFKMKPEGRRQYQVIALRIICEHGGTAPISHVRGAIQARHPDNKWDKRYPLKILGDHGIVEHDDENVWLCEQLDSAGIASVLTALEERSVRTQGLRVEDTSWRPDSKEWTALRTAVVNRDGKACSVDGCNITDGLQLDHIWRGSLLAAIGWSPSAINDPTNLQLLCDKHHRSKTLSEARLLAVSDERTSK